MRALPFVREGKSTADAKVKLMEVFYRADLDGGGVSASDVELDAKIAAARQRAAQALQLLMNDLDGNGELTRAELEVALGAKAFAPLRSEGGLVAPTEEQAAEVLQNLVSKAMQADQDGDGTITIREMLAQRGEEMRIPVGRPKQEFPSGLDADKDGVIASDEYAAAVDRALASIDTDGDGTFSEAEAAAFAVRQQKIGKAVQAALAAKQAASLLERQVQQCGFPAAAEDAEIVFVMAYEGNALSTVALGDEDAVISVADVAIEPGEKPIYLVLGSAQGMIWRLSGDVGRLAKVVASAKPGAEAQPLVGIVGVPRDRVHLLPAASCLPYFGEREAVRAAKTLGLLSAALGRKPDVVLSRYEVRKVAVPSGKFDDATPYPDAEPINEHDGPAKALWREALRSNAGGVVRVDPDAVVSGPKPVRYSVLPEHAGLAQLVESGALRITGEQTAIVLGNTEIIGSGGDDSIIVPKGTKPVVSRRPSEFLIVKKIRFPAGMSGAHSVRFLLGPGVPRPDGDPGHSCLLEQATGKQLGRGRC